MKKYTQKEIDRIIKSWEEDFKLRGQWPIDDEAIINKLVLWAKDNGHEYATD